MYLHLYLHFLYSYMKSSTLELLRHLNTTRIEPEFGKLAPSQTRIETELEIHTQSRSHVAT